MVRLAPDDRIQREWRKVVGFYSQFAQREYNRTHNDPIESDETATSTIFRSDAAFAVGVQPTHSLRDNYFFLASSPAVLDGLTIPAAPPEVANEIRLLHVWCSRVYAYGTTHRDAIAAYLASQQRRPEATVRKELDSVLDVLAALDEVKLVLRGNGEIKSLAVHVKCVKPLRAEATRK
jgi:hypothetical protein